MKVIAINGCARKNGNSAKMLEYAIRGARENGAKISSVNLYDLNYKGCTGCYACKKLGGSSYGRCAVRDDLTHVLDMAIDADAVLMASPIYWHDVTGELRSFMERFLFPTYTYSKERNKLYPHRIKIGMIYTMNLQESTYKDLILDHKKIFDRVIGDCEYVVAENTYQFDDYSQYDANMFDLEEKAMQRIEKFPIECENAYEMGKRLTNRG